MSETNVLFSEACARFDSFLKGEGSEIHSESKAEVNKTSEKDNPPENQSKRKVEIEDGVVFAVDTKATEQPEEPEEENEEEEEEDNEDDFEYYEDDELEEGDGVKRTRDETELEAVLQKFFEAGYALGVYQTKKRLRK